MKAPPKNIDLGAIQDHYTACKKLLAKAAKHLVKAQEDFDRAKAAFEAARDQLKNSSRAVLD